MDDPQLQEQLEIFAPEYREFIIGPVPEMMAVAYGEPLELSDKETTVLENSFRLYLMAMLAKEEWVEFITTYTSLEEEIARSVVQEMNRFVAPELQAKLEQIQAQTGDQDMNSDANSASQEISPNTTKNHYTQKQTDPTLIAQQREDLLKEIEAAEEKLASIQPIRTMQTDYQNTKQPTEENTGNTNSIASQPQTEETSSQTPSNREVETKNNDEEPVHRTSQDDLLGKKQDAQQYATLTPKQEQTPKWGSEDS